MTAPAVPDSGTLALALLVQKVDRLMVDMHDFMEEVRACNESNGKRLAELERWTATSQERWAQHESQHEDLAFKRNVGDIAGYVAAVAAALAGIFLNKP